MSTRSTPFALPTPDSYWVIPGRLLAGEYPSHKDDAQVLLKLRRFQKAGITLFFDLTEAGEHGLRPYAPLLPQAFAATGDRVRHRCFPIPDMGTPDVAQMAAIQESLAAHLASGETVYVHCYGGIGRTGTVIGCYLVSQGMSGDSGRDRRLAPKHSRRLAAGPRDGSTATESAPVGCLNAPFPLSAPPSHGHSANPAIS
jgi:hypothetical protein